MRLRQSAGVTECQTAAELRRRVGRVGFGDAIECRQGGGRTTGALQRAAKFQPCGCIFAVAAGRRCQRRIERRVVELEQHSAEQQGRFRKLRRTCHRLAQWRHRLVGGTERHGDASRQDQGRNVTGTQRQAPLDAEPRLGCLARPQGNGSVQLEHRRIVRCRATQRLAIRHRPGQVARIQPGQHVAKAPVDLLLPGMTRNVPVRRRSHLILERTLSRAAKSARPPQHPGPLLPYRAWARIRPSTTAPAGRRNAASADRRTGPAR